MGLSRGRRGEGGSALEGEEESGWLQRCGYESVPEWFFWFLVGSRPTGGLTGTGNQARSSGFLSDLFAVARLMASRRCQNALRSPRPRETEGLVERKKGGKGGSRETGTKGQHTRGD